MKIIKLVALKEANIFHFERVSMSNFRVAYLGQCLMKLGSLLVVVDHRLLQGYNRENVRGHCVRKI